LKIKIKAESNRQTARYSVLTDKLRDTVYWQTNCETQCTDRQTARHSVLTDKLRDTVYWQTNCEIQCT